MIAEASRIIKNAKHVTAFTGAGVSVESGIPPFRGDTGLWSKYNPIVLDIDYFHKNPLAAWKVIKEIFYDFFGEAKPNMAHFALAELEQLGILKSIITQNIDNLHQQAGSKVVYEFHGTSQSLVCEKCFAQYHPSTVDLGLLPPKCSVCETVLKPDFVFFGEQIPEPASSNSFGEASEADVFLLIGTTGEIMPASLIPHQAKRNGATIIEVNVEKTNFTESITDYFLEGTATEVINNLLNNIKKEKE